MAAEATDEANLLSGSEFEDDGRVTLMEKNQLHSEVMKLASNEESDDCGGDVSIKKMPTTLPVKRPLDDSRSSHPFVKKTKLASYDDDDDDDDDIPVSSMVKKTAESAGESFSLLKKFMDKKLASVEKSIEKCQRKRQVKERRLNSLERDIEECTKELENKRKQVSCTRKINEVYQKMQTKIEECAIEIVTQETLHILMEGLVTERELQLKTKEIEIDQVMHKFKKDREAEEEELVVLFQKNVQCTEELMAKEEELKTKKEELDAVKKLIDGQEKELESEREKLHKVLSMRAFQCAQMKDFESMKEQVEGQLKEFNLKEEDFERRVKEAESNFGSQEKDIESKRKQLEGKLEELKSKGKQLTGQEKELESRNEHFDSLEKELKLKKEQLEGKVKEFELKEEKFKGKVMEFESREQEFVEQVKDLESKKKHFESQMEDHKSKEKQLEGRVEELELKEKQLKCQVKEFESKKEEFVEQVKDVESKKKHFESQTEELKSNEKLLEGRLKELESKETQLVDQVKEFELKKEEFESHVKKLGSEERSKKQYEGLVKSIKEENDLDEPESIGNEILVGLKETSDPSKVVLDIISKPIIPQFKNEDKALVMERSHIFLLEQLLRISPCIKPGVRGEAMKVALDLKDNIRTSSKNSLEVLGFLLLLSIYGLVPFFDEEEVLELLEFAGKSSDFVQNLVKKGLYIEAVRFISPFKLADKNQPVDLLREYIKNAKLMSESQDKARDQEIATVTSVLLCISDNNLESEVLLNDIQDFILYRQKGTRVHSVTWVLLKMCNNLRKRNMARRIR